QLVEEWEQRGKISFPHFYARRARRIIPAATVVIVSTLLAAWAWLSPLRIPSLTRDAILAAVSGINFRLAQQGTDYFHASAPPSALQHYRALSAQLTWLGLGMIVLAALVFDGATAYPGSAVALPVLGAAFVIAGGCGASRRTAELLLGRAPMQVVGRMSYSLYLWHWPILIF